MAGEFAQLLPFTWRGVHLPVTRIRLSIAHDLVEHKYWGVDGGRVEDTGIAPVRISATIPISNSIVPGKNEKWQAGVLYPDALRALILAFGKRTAGLVQHPEFGEIACKAERLEFELSGDHQDSTEVQCSWIETLDEEVISNIVPSPVQEIEIAASDLTASDADLRKLVPELPVFRDDLESLGRKISAIGDQISVLRYTGAGAVDRIIHQANRIGEAIDRAKSALTWQSKQNVERVKASAHDVRKRIVDVGRAFNGASGIGLYVLRSDSTLAGVVTELPPGTPMGTVIALNPALCRSPIVPRGTSVRYPLAA